MNSSLDSYLANSKMAKNRVWGTDTEILSAASLLSTDIFVYTQFLGYIQMAEIFKNHD